MDEASDQAAETQQPDETAAGQQDPVSAFGEQVTEFFDDQFEASPAEAFGGLGPLLEDSVESFVNPEESDGTSLIEPGDLTGPWGCMLVPVLGALVLVAAIGFMFASSGGGSADTSNDDGNTRQRSADTGAAPSNSQDDNQQDPGSGGGAGTGGEDAADQPGSGDGAPWLIPVTGDWIISSEGGSFGCDTPVELGGSTDRAFIDVSPDGAQIVITDYDDETTLALDLIDGSPTHATYYVDLTPIVGFRFEMSMTFDTPTTMGGALSGCPERGGQGYLLEARDAPGDGGIVTAPPLGVGATCEDQLNAIDASLRTDPSAAVATPDLDELQACLTPFNGLIIVQGLPDLSGVYYTGSQFGRSWGADQVITLDTCAVAGDGAIFQTDLTVESTQVWVGLQKPDEAGDTDNAQVGALRLRENGPPSHSYIPLAHREEGVIDVRTSHIPGENPWGGWAVMTTAFFNEADFFPYTAEFFEGEPTYGGTFTLVCG